MVVTKEDKAKSIINCAQVLGLHVNLDMPEAIKEVSRELREGTL